VTGEYTVALISAVASVLTAAGIIFIYYQVRLLSKQLSADHERSRRERAIDLMAGWLDRKSRQPEWIISAMLLIETLDEVRCRVVWEKGVMPLDAGIKPAAERFLADANLGAPETRTDGTAVLTEVQTSVLRGCAVDLLNSLEVVATAWRHNVCDRAIIEEEFLDVIFFRTNRARLEVFRRASGVYPSLGALTRHLQDTRRAADKPALPS
jgi:hypothetical protein